MIILTATTCNKFHLFKSNDKYVVGGSRQMLCNIFTDDVFVSFEETL